MDRILNYYITDSDKNTAILDFLRKKGFSRHILTSMKADTRAILLNGQPAGGRILLSPGDVLRIRVKESAPSEKIHPVNLPFSILYEDPDILVVNKPAGMPVHPSPGNYDNTLANAAAFYFSEKGESCACRCINRLDRDTTGALILAKNPLSAAILSRQMKQRQIRRTYLALACGVTPESGTIDAPIARVPGSVLQREVNFAKGEPAVTHYQRLAVNNHLSLIELRLETGRTHQIRVHMKHLGCPLPGDFLYNPDFKQIRRQALHSYQLEFLHPVTGEPLCFTAPVPEDFCRAFSGMQPG